jgi:preprotein translocase subunit SecF
LIYVGLRFEYKFAPGAVFCLFHDAIITLGVYALFDWEVTTQTMAAVLTIIGYSLNDTIVIFDRIRENSHIHRGKSFAWLANRSINDCLSRTILTYIFTFMTVFAMYFLAGGVIADFARTMIIGMCLGVYSTVYVATPLVLLLDRLQGNKA